LVSVFFFLFLYSTFYGEESAFLFLLWLDFQCSSVLVAIVLKPVNRGITLGLWIKKKTWFFQKEKVNGLMILLDYKGQQNEFFSFSIFFQL
jgi:hypothetical protein